MNLQKDNTSNTGLLTKPLLIGFLTFTLLASICAYLAYQRYTILRNEERENAQNMAESVRSRLQQALQYSLSATQAMTLLIDKQGIPANFDSIAPYIFKAHKYIDALELVPEGVIRYVYPATENEGVIGYNILLDPTRNKEAYKAIEKKQLFFAGPFKLKQDGIGVVGRLPVFINDKFWGFSAVVIRLPTLLKAAGIDTAGNTGYFFQLSKINPDTKKEEFFLPFRGFSAKQYEAEVAVPDGEWKLLVMPVNGYKSLQGIIPVAILGLILSLTGAIFAIYASRTPARLQQLVSQRTEELRQLSNHLADVREEERLNIAREIHDELGQHLTVLKMNFSFLETSIIETDNRFKPDLDKIANLINDMMKAVRKISHELRPGLLDALGLIAALEWHCKDFEKKTGIRTSFITEFPDGELPDKIRTGLFRIFQESLTNVARHAEAKRVDASLNLQDKELVMLIEDDGKGFNTTSEYHHNTLGILGMKERAIMMGGTYTIQSSPGKGTIIEVIVPFSNIK